MTRTATVVASLILMTGLAGAQGPGAGDLGYVSIETLGLLDPARVEVNINLTGAMLQALAASSEGSDADLAQLLQDVRRIRVLAGPMAAGDPETLVQSFRSAVDRLESEGWIKLVSVREEGIEEVAVLSLESGNLIHGLAVLVLDGDEGVLVNMVGEMRPEVMGRLLGSLDALDSVAAELSAKAGAH
jgi:hypothetical protein